MKIITIGGGEIAHQETLSIDRKIAALADKERPHVLFIPTASNDASQYCKNFEAVYGGTLGCQVDFLLSSDPAFSLKSAQQLIANADIVYVGGGNTRMMLDRWRVLNLSETLISAAREGIIMAGLSAGAICWFEAGLSDSQRFTHSSGWQYQRITGLGLLPGLFCPHLDAEGRLGPLANDVLASPCPAVACDNGAAVFWEGGQGEVLTSLPGAHVYHLSPGDGAITVTCFSHGETIRL